VHGREHWTEFYTDYGVNLQKKFFGHFLKGENTGWADQPRVLLQVRHPGEVFVERAEADWPLPSTHWVTKWLDASDLTLKDAVPGKAASVSYAGFGDGVTFTTPPMAAATELTGPMAAKLFIASETEDADLFLVVRVFAPDFKEVVFQGALDPNTPIAQGWLRASHRKLDKDLSEVYRPYHTHDEKQPLTPGHIYELDVEIWPSCIVVPPGYRVALSVRGKDYAYPGGASEGLETLGTAWSGCGPFTHTDPRDRPAHVFGGTVTLHTGPEHPSWLLLPVIPAA
jgi:predicted acyl esterase